MPSHHAPQVVEEVVLRHLRQYESSLVSTVLLPSLQPCLESGELPGGREEGPVRLRAVQLLGRVAAKCATPSHAQDILEFLDKVHLGMSSDLVVSSKPCSQVARVSRAPPAAPVRH